MNRKTITIGAALCGLQFLAWTADAAQEAHSGAPAAAAQADSDGEVFTCADGHRADFQQKDPGTNKWYAHVVEHPNSTVEHSDLTVDFEPGWSIDKLRKLNHSLHSRYVRFIDEKPSVVVGSMAISEKASPIFLKNDDSSSSDSSSENDDLSLEEELAKLRKKKKKKKKKSNTSRFGAALAQYQRLKEQESSRAKAAAANSTTAQMEKMFLLLRAHEKQKEKQLQRKFEKRLHDEQALEMGLQNKQRGYEKILIKQERERTEKLQKQGEERMRALDREKQNSIKALEQKRLEFVKSAELEHKKELSKREEDFHRQKVFVNEQLKIAIQDAKEAEERAKIFLKPDDASRESAAREQVDVFLELDAGESAAEGFAARE